MLFRILGPQPGVLLEGSDELVTPAKLDMQMALALLATKIDTELHRDLLAEIVLPDSPYVSIAELLRQKHNVARVSASVGWLRKALPDGDERMPPRRTKGGATYYKLIGSQKEVDAWVLVEAKAHAERSLKARDFSAAIVAARHGLSLWVGPLRHRYFETTTAGKQIAELVMKACESLYDLLTDAAIGLNDDLPGAVQELERQLMARSEFRDRIAYNLIRLHRANGDDAEARRLRVGLNVDNLPEDWARRIDEAPDDVTSGSPDVTIPDDSLTTSLPPEMQVSIRQLDPTNRAQTSLMEMLSTTQIHPDFRLFIVSGVSAAGKDTLVATASDEATIAQKFEILTKYTTRPPRTNEAGYSRSVGWDEFLRLVGNGEVAFLYEKRQEMYGFDLPQLERAMSQGSKVVAIFTEFDQVPEARALLNAHGAVVVPILINADFQTARRRTKLRQFSQEEQAERIESIMDDVARMSTRSIEDEYVVIPHSNDYGFNGALKQLRRILDGTDPKAARFVRN